MRVFIENEAGSSVTRAHDARADDETTRALPRASRGALAYPYPYGFVLGTRSGHGEAVDCFVLTRTPLGSGTIVECHPVGLIEQFEDGEIDHKILALLPGELMPTAATVRATIAQFVTGAFAQVPGKRIESGRLLGRTEAEAYLRECSARPASNGL